MPIIFFTFILGLLALCYVLLGERGERPLSRRLSEGPKLPLYVICGNCSGDGERPLRTEMTDSGRCSNCGGTSLQLLSRLGGDNYGRPTWIRPDEGTPERRIWTN